MSDTTTILARTFDPRDAGAIAWQADELRSSNPHKNGTAAHRLWNEGWDQQQDAWEDAEAGFPIGGVGGWIGSADHLAEARALGLTALD